MRAQGFGLTIAVALLAASCTTSPDPPVSFVVGLRVLAGQGQPPEVAPGAVSQVSLLVVDTGGLPVDVSWSRCTLAPHTGEAVNPDCVKGGGPPALEPLGAGTSIAFTMPQVTAAELGAPDATNGVYVPLVAKVSDGASAVTAVYRLRLGGAAPPNMNPAIANIDVVDAAGAATPIDPATPLGVSAGQKITLSATLAPGSAETYTAINGMSKTEMITVSWFCTAGALSVEKTSASQPQTVLDLSKNPPIVGGNVDLFAVAHDERGGVGYTHVVLELH
jgi:hypothetical protein